MLAVCVLAGCGKAHEGQHAQPTTTGIRAITARQQAASDRLYLAITGSARQRAAGARRSYRVEFASFTACVRRSGVPYAPPRFVNQWTDWPSSGSSTSDSGFLAPVDRPWYLVRFEQVKAASERSAAAAAAEYAHTFDALSPAGRTRRRAAVASCKEGKRYVSAWHPRLYMTLDYAYHRMLNRVDMRVAAESEARYSTCMRAQGYTGLRDYEDFEDTLEARLPSPASIPPLGKRGGAKWRAWVALERNAVAADGHCRRSAYLKGTELLAPVIQRFRLDHAAQLAREADGWRAITRHSE